MDPEVGEIDLATIKTRSLTGIATLISRSFILQIISTLGFLALTAFLGIPEVGLFNATSDMVSILGYFSDIGLAASLIQKKAKLTLLDLRTTFTLQQILVTVSIIVLLIVTPAIRGFFSISPSGTWLIYSLLAGFFLASLKTIPSVILERQLKFQTLAAVEIIENLVFYTVAVILAWQGRGVASYAWAVLLRGVIGTAFMYWMAPWQIGLGFSTSSLRSLLSFGLPYQINSFLAVIKDRFLNIVLWKIIGAEGVGIIGWAQTWSQKPLRFIMDNVTKVTFPGFARLQDHPEQLRHAIEKTLFFITSLTFPIVLFIALTAPAVTQLIPRYSKWEVALLPLVLFCLGSAWASISTPLTNTLNALGLVKTNTYLMLMWLVLTWLLVPGLALRFGFLGVAYAGAIISFSSIVPIVIVHKITRFNISKALLAPCVASLALLLIYLSLANIFTLSWASLIIISAISGLCYLFSLFLFTGRQLLTDSLKLWYAFRHQK